MMDNSRINDQLRILTENLSRQSEVSKSKEMENYTLHRENTVLKEQYDELKNRSHETKDDQTQLIENLKI